MMECKIKMWRSYIWRVVHHWWYVLPAALHPNSVAFIETIIRWYLQVAILKAALLESPPDTDIIKFGWELDTMVSCFHEHITWYTFYTSRHTAAHLRLLSLQDAWYFVYRRVVTYKRIRSHEINLKIKNLKTKLLRYHTRYQCHIVVLLYINTCKNRSQLIC